MTILSEYSNVHLFLFENDSSNFFDESRQILDIIIKKVINDAKN